MTKEEAIKVIKDIYNYTRFDTYTTNEARTMAIKALEQGAPIDKSAMMIEIYMEGVNMSGEYQGCWVRFKDIERIVDKYITESEEGVKI